LNLPGRAGFGYGEDELPPGGRLLIASDGVLEIEPKKSFRERRSALVEITRSANDLDAVLASLGFREATQRGDDVALLLLAREESHG
jgi:serine phosphatase RsbU (regulator of sigma subunit)